jgi:hypothetical protein
LVYIYKTNDTTKSVTINPKKFIINNTNHSEDNDDDEEKIDKLNNNNKNDDFKIKSNFELTNYDENNKENNNNKFLNESGEKKTSKRLYVSRSN